MKSLMTPYAVAMVTVSLCSLASASRPHIVLIVADDLGWDDVGFHGSEIKTPNIDTLAYEGVILNNYYVSPICTPTRGSLMTGRHPIHLGLQTGVITAAQPWGLPLTHTTMAQHLKHLDYATHLVGKVNSHSSIGQTKGESSRLAIWCGLLCLCGLGCMYCVFGPRFKFHHTGLQHYVIAAPEPWGLPLNHTTMAQHFKRLDYATHIVGKWHLGFFRDEYLPTSRGFDSHFGYWAGKEDYYDHIDIDGYTGLDFRRNMEVVNKTAYSTELYTSEAVDIINKHNKSQPLFLYMAHQAVHAGNRNDPLQAPKQYVDRFPYIDNLRRRTFAGMVAALDDSVGEIVRTLDHNGMMDNTIVVFTTDNGGPANNYDGNAACNYPLRGTKNTLWEGGVHGVGFVHSRLIQNRHVKSDSLIHVSDWLPTLYSAAGGNVSDLGQVDGIDLWKMIQTNGSNVRTELLHNIDPVNKFSAIRVGDYKLIQGHISNADDKWYPCNPPVLDKMNTTDKYDFSRKNAQITDNSTFIQRKNKLRHFNKRYAPYTPYNVDCGAPPANYSTNCQPHKSPCLYHIVTDPCEYNNIADAYPAVVQKLLQRLKAYTKSAVKPVNKGSDPKANPALHGGVWVPWQGS